MTGLHASKVARLATFGTRNRDLNPHLMMKSVLFPPCIAFALIAFTQSYEEGSLKACNLLCSTDQAGFAVLGRSADETRELAQGFYWKTLEASAASMPSL